MPVGPRSSRILGYWLLSADGSVMTHGALWAFGSVATGGGLRPQFSGIVGTATAAGYWIVEQAGRVHAFGDAPAVAFDDGPVATLAPTGGGAWVVSEEGSIKALGDAPPPPVATGIKGVIGAAVSAAHAGWLLTGDGDVHPLGGAAHFGSPAELGESDVVGIAATPTGSGYWVCGQHGELFGFGDASFDGSPTTDGAKVEDVIAIDSTLPGGYVLVTAGGMILPFGAIDPGPLQAGAIIPDKAPRIAGIALVACATA